MRKFKADWIFDGRRLLPGTVLTLEDDGTVAGLLPSAGTHGDAGHNDAEYFDGVLAPGFINAHCHLELSHMKGIVPKGSGLVDFVLQLQRSRHFPEGIITAAMEKAESEMRSEGIIGVGDIANSGASFPLKERSEIRYHTFIEVFGFDPGRAQEVFSKARKLQERAMRPFGTSIGPEDRALMENSSGPENHTRPKNSSTIVPHSPYSVSENLFSRIAENAASGKRPALVSIHNQESPHEDVFYREGTGDITRLYSEFGIDISFYCPYSANALPTWLPWLGSSGKKLLVHNTYTTAGDVEFALEQGETCWCLCPNANLYIENRLPNIPMFIEKGCKLVLGTDSLASNDRLSILEEMKTISRHFPQIELEQLLQWATLNGSEFFGWKDLGSFEKGKKPGVNLLSGLNGLRLTEGTTLQRLV